MEVRPQTQVSVDTANDDAESELTIWMRHNKATKWTANLLFILHEKAHHSVEKVALPFNQTILLNTDEVSISVIIITQFNVIFSCAQQLGLSSRPFQLATTNRLTKEEELLTLTGQSSID
ncbi:unnamed protein product [Didymodactylos carnosus]|uniref:Uncharacterized protein n=1 Tax=Didymodactylos carnosus TaxID=1234261 RepID=A0A815Z3V1_9BILA|nr:unnamed protein product [Didymodactylos carnosus]CAF1577801.1 unnamed protein product [Didymodactylos carnosus]CAF4099385.1 unnamed protein product [Didymodactylos carnosus]CAF4443824.1 unnamed protein product [Didymodactylos carnosus]